LKLWEAKARGLIDKGVNVREVVDPSFVK